MLTKAVPGVFLMPPVKSIEDMERQITWRLLQPFGFTTEGFKRWK